MMGLAFSNCLEGLGRRYAYGNWPSGLINDWVALGRSCLAASHSRSRSVIGPI